MTSPPVPIWRSLLFVPVTARRFVDGAARRGADAIILDLEDSVASPEEIDHARRVAAAYDKALAEGVGAATVDGKMIDVPIVERARLLIEREAAIAAREARMHSLQS